jgi:hypothetical protein
MVADPCADNMQGVFRSQFRFSTRPQILEQPFPRGHPSPPDDALKLGPQIAQPHAPAKAASNNRSLPQHGIDRDPATLLPPPAPSVVFWLRAATEGRFVIFTVDQ